MKPGKYISLLFVLLYVALCFRMSYMEDADSELKKSDMDKNMYIAKVLSDDGELTLLSDQVCDYNYSYSEKILNYHVIADTTLRNVVFENDSYYLKAVAKSESEEKILLKLKIDKKLADELKTKLYSNCVIVANLSNVQSLPFSKTLTDLEDNVIWSQEKNDILLEGQLLEITQITKNS